MAGLSWVAMESNPDMMNEFGKKLGMDLGLYSFQDCWGLDMELLLCVNQPCLAVILLFPCKLGCDDSESTVMEETNKPLWIPQLIGNACGTMAVLHALCNNVDTITTTECKLRDLVNEMSAMNSKERGEYLTKVDAVEEAHSSVIDSGSTEAPAAGADVDHHFSCFILHEGKIVELDGRRSGAIVHQEATEEEFLFKTADIIKSEFISKSPDDLFNVITLSKSS